MLKKCRKGFTLSELLIIVSVIAVLVAIAIPIFTSQLEKSREAADLANIRSAYAQVMADVVSDGKDHKSETIILKQKKDDWQNTTGGQSLGGIAVADGVPSAGGTAWVEYKAENEQVLIHYKNPGPSVPGSQATMDAQNFPEGSRERLILATLEEAERQALQLYENAGETTAVGYLVRVNSDGTFTLERVLNKQIFHEKSPNSIMTEGYMVAVRDGKVGSNLVYDPVTNTLKGVKYHIYVNQWHNETEGISFDY